MLHRSSIVGIAAALTLSATGAFAFDETKYPDWSGQWRRPPGAGTQWDQTKSPGLGQEAPLKPEYVKLLQDSLKDQEDGGQGLDSRFTCRPNGMPRLMTMTWPAEFVITPNVTFFYSENNMPRRIYTDGRAFPKDEEPSYNGVSIGRWLDTDSDGRYDTLEVETRNFKGPRTMEPSGIALAPDNETILKERITLDKNVKDTLLNEITTIDNAFTRPWTVTKRYTRIKKVIWFENDCNEYNNHVVIAKDNYYLSADGYLMPARKNQAPPDLRYFPQAKK
jgi:hypothetical protein